MKTIAHISDLHFGAADPLIAERLAESIASARPDLLVVSGDLTQRARRTQFAEARAYLDRFRMPKIIVPGNHDVPLYNVFNRFIDPLRRYRQIITPDLRPFYADEHLAVAGINTARSMTIKGGRINRSQIEEVRSRMCTLDERVLKIVVTHHPFDVPEGRDDRDIVGRADVAMPLIASCGADVFLAGHLHVAHIGHSARRYHLPGGFSALIVQAGTAISHRGRGENNSYNLIRFHHPTLTVQRLECASPSEPFTPTSTESFTHTTAGWQRQ